jgi:hypothetical protein
MHRKNENEKIKSLKNHSNSLLSSSRDANIIYSSGYIQETFRRNISKKYLKEISQRNISKKLINILVSD